MLYFLQHYWWLVVSLLGSLLVFLMFVQGGQSLLFFIAKKEDEKRLLINALGHKWEFTFTTLVTFGGAMFASFPLYYSTSFGGAYWLWMSILFLFVIQAVSFEYRGKVGNLYGSKTYDTFLFLNGTVAPILLGVAVGTFFSGGAFTMDKMNIASVETGSISRWANGWHGLDAIIVPFNLLMGVVVVLAARTLGLLYIILQIDHQELVCKAKDRVKITGSLFVLTFVVLLIMLFTKVGYEVDPLNGSITAVKYKYLINMLQLVWPLILLLTGVVLVLLGLIRTIILDKSNGFYFSGAGVVLAVWSLLISAAFNNTVFFPSTYNIDQSLTLYNSSSSLLTLKTMAYASLFIPVVFAYIVYVWRALTKTKMNIKELEEGEGHKY